MSESKRIKIGDQAASPVNTESEYEALKKEIALLKQTVEEQCAWEREKIAELKAHEDISQLLVTGKWSDVTISVGGKDFAVHKGILSARSSIFADLLEKNCKENRLVINEIDVDVFEILLSFIYAGKVPALEPKMAQDLMAAAEKYQLEQLKEIAEDYLNSPASPSTTPRPLPPIARLHDPCLVALFRQLPPADQITARTVCRRWADLVPYAARSTRSLAILVNHSLDEAEHQFNYFLHGPGWRLFKLLRKEDGTPLLPMHSLSQWNSLQLSTLDEQTASQIMATFPVLKELQLSAQGDEECCTATTPPLSFLDHLIRLLEHWRPQLTTLKLDVEISFEAVSSCSRLGLAISSLPALQHLVFYLQWNNHPHCPLLSNLPQLSHFTVYSNPTQFVDMLRQYDPLHLARVQISYGRAGYYDHWGEMENPAISQFTSLNADLRRRFLRIDDPRPADYRTICTHFPSLTSANLFLSEATFRDFLTHVSQLTQLIYLKLHIDFSAIRPDDQPHRLLPQLKSVKLLHLVITNLQSHSDLEPLNLPWTIPNMQVLDIDFGFLPLQCTPCGIRKQSTPKEKQEHCLRQMIAPLKGGCTGLHTIKHSLKKELGTAEEILAEEPVSEAASSSIDTEPMDVSAGN